MVDKGFHVPSGNYFGLMNPTPTYMGVMAETLVAAPNPQLATVKRSQLASKIEHETIRWIGVRVGWPGEFNGTSTTGGNEANFEAWLWHSVKVPKRDRGWRSLDWCPTCALRFRRGPSLD